MQPQANSDGTGWNHREFKTSKAGLPTLFREAPVYNIGWPFEWDEIVCHALISMEVILQEAVCDGFADPLSLPTVVQVKSKFSGLRIYMSVGRNEDAAKIVRQMYELVTAAENKVDFYEQVQLQNSRTP